MRFSLILLIINFLFASLAVDLIGNKFDKPLYILELPDNSDKLLVLEQDGVIRILQDGQKSKTPFLDITDRVHNPMFPGDERGLLGFAFHPDFVSNHYFYVYYTTDDDKSVLSRFSTNGIIGDKSTENILLSFEQPYSNHNGGCIEFGPDGYLYVSVGDGGSTGDPEKRAQDLTNIFGTILRLDVNDNAGYIIPNDNPFVDTPNAKDEIWSYGLRNVWRFSFDALTGDMIMADVGQNLWEEINFEPHTSKGGLNFGWNVFEGNHCYPEDVECIDEGFTKPVFEYPNNANYAKTLFGIKQPNMDGCSITGGYVYRGSNIKSLYGKYVFGDYCTGKIWSLKINQDGLTSNLVDHTSEILKSMNKKEFYLSSFGQDNDNELFLIDYNGSIYKLKEEL